MRARLISVCSALLLLAAACGPAVRYERDAKVMLYPALRNNSAVAS